MYNEKTSAPRVSVIMPVYNAERFLAEAIESILSQQYRDFEFLIHDDGSADGSANIIRRYAERDDRILPTYGENRGVSAASNDMISRARGMYLARMDADDVALPHRLGKQIEEMERRPGIAVLGTASINMDEEGRSISSNIPPLHHQEIDEGNLRGHVGIHQPTTMMRADVIKAMGGYDVILKNAEDLDLWLRVGEVSQLANISEICLKYRIHRKSLSGSKRDEQMRNALAVCQAARERRRVDAPFEYQHWRMDDSRESKRSYHLRYAWQAWAEGYRGTWRHYALDSVRLAPFSLAAWKVLILGAVRRPPKRQEVSASSS